ncbi:MAG TPA: hypothetical protein EYP32_04145 [Aquificaceae bacterium]|nr:hypothetical protein [Aquificaceae bacterium]
MERNPQSGMFVYNPISLVSNKPFKILFLLRHILKLQERIGKRIISDEELAEIERIWKKEAK